MIHFDENGKELLYKCRCNNCMETFISADNSSLNELLPDNGESDLQFFENGEDSFWGCPVCETDEHLMDLSE